MQKGWSLFFGAVLAGITGLTAFAGISGKWWLPPNICVFGGETDDLFYLILWLVTFFFLLTQIILVYAMYRFSGQPGRKASYFHGVVVLELIWTAVPAAILLFIAFAQIQAWNKIKVAARMPEPDQVIHVSARQFEWRMRYPTDPRFRGASALRENAKLVEQWSKEAQFDDLRIVNEVHIWEESRVRIHLTTRDVIHSFFLPNLRIKQDALPGKTIPVWFAAEKGTANTHYNPDTKKWDVPTENADLACAELCGWGHYKMRGRLYIHANREDYENWLKQSFEDQSRHAGGESASQP
jgi:cytochrome c oxidase subunit II